MSETVHYRGELTPLNVSDIEIWAEKILKDNNVKPEDYYDSFEEQLVEELEDYIVLSGQAYKIKKEQIDVNDDIIEAAKLPGGNISFELRYYNGGCGFGEALEEAVSGI